MQLSIRLDTRLDAVLLTEKLPAGVSYLYTGLAHVPPGSNLSEEGVASSQSLLAMQLSIRLDAVLMTEKLPAGVSYLYTGLAHVHRDTFTLLKKEKRKKKYHEQKINKESFILKCCNLHLYLKSNHEILN